MTARFLNVAKATFHACTTCKHFTLRSNDHRISRLREAQTFHRRAQRVRHALTTLARSFWGLIRRRWIAFLNCEHRQKIPTAKCRRIFLCRLVHFRLRRGREKILFLKNTKTCAQSLDSSNERKARRKKALRLMKSLSRKRAQVLYDLAWLQSMTALTGAPKSRASLTFPKVSLHACENNRFTY